MFVFVNIRKWLENNATCELNFSNIENEVLFGILSIIAWLDRQVHKKVSGFFVNKYIFSSYYASQMWTNWWRSMWSDPLNLEITTWEMSEHQTIASSIFNIRRVH